MPTIKEFYENIIAENEKLYENWKPLFLNYLEGLETKQREFISRHKLRVLTYFENMTVNLVNTYQDNELIKEEMLRLSNKFIKSYALLWDKTEEATQEVILMNREGKEDSFPVWGYYFINIPKGESFPEAMKMYIEVDRKCGELYYMTKGPDGQFMHNKTYYDDVNKLDVIKEEIEKNTEFLYWTW